LELSAFVDDDGFERVAEGVLATHGNRVSSDPLQHPSLVLAADTRTVGSAELTLAVETPAVGDLPAEWRETLAETYVPRRLLAPRPAGDADLDGWLDALGLDDVPPIWAGREARDGEPTVYACQSRACSPPRHDPGEALSWFGE
jgi:uncharacterized protein YyaL (SSP411 family)